MDLLTDLSGLPDACCKELFVVEKCPQVSVRLGKTSSPSYLVFSHKMLSQQGLFGC